MVVMKRVRDGGWCGMRALALVLMPLASLAAEQREAVVLFEVDGFSIEEIAAMQRVSISAVKSRLTRGRERLRVFYQRCGWHSTPARHASGSMAREGRSRDDLETEGLLRFASASPRRLLMEERSHE